MRCKDCIEELSGCQVDECDGSRKTITVEEIRAEWGYYAKEYLAEILRGEWSVEDARHGILSFRKNKVSEE